MIYCNRGKEIKRIVGATLSKILKYVNKQYLALGYLSRVQWTPREIVVIAIVLTSVYMWIDLYHL